MSAEKVKLNDKIQKLDKIVEWFDGDDFALDNAIDKYKTAAKLAKEIEKDLDELKNEVEVLADFTK